MIFPKIYWLYWFLPFILQHLGQPSSMVSTLQEMGVTAPFESTKADPQLLIMTSDSEAYVSDMMHKASVKSTEEGTVAAAASTVVIMTRSLPPPELKVIANRPSPFVIHERSNGLVPDIGRRTTTLGNAAPNTKKKIEHN